MTAPPMHVPWGPPEVPEATRPRSRGWVFVLLGFAVVVAGGLGVKYVSEGTLQTVQPPTTPTPTPNPTVNAPKAGRLSVKTEPAVEVFEGKTSLGKSPLEVELPVGSHTVRLVNRPAGIDATVTVELAAGGEANISEVGKGTISVKAQPWAYVKIDGRQLGQTPVARQVFEGVHSVELANPGLNESRRLDVRVKAGETKTVNVNLEGEPE